MRVCRGIEGDFFFCCGCSHVLAAYASFLWEAEEEEDEGEVEQGSHSFMGSQVVAGSIASTNV